jgi:DNA polymerase III delta subunit
VATFSQWRTAFEKSPKPKQITWICGTERVLMDDVVDAIRAHIDLDPWGYTPLVVGEDSERTVWAELDSHPIGSASRLVVIRNADELKDWDRLIEWISHRSENPRTFLVFVSNEDKIARTEVTPEAKRKGEKPEMVPHLAAFAGKGSVIECKPFTASTVKQAVKWVQTRVPMRDALAAHLLNRADGDLRLTRDLCSKLAVLPVEPSIQTINSMLQEQPRDSFSDALLALDKKTALLALERLKPSEYSRLIGLLDSQIEFAEIIHNMLLEHKTPGEMARAVGNRGFLVAEVIPVAKHYNSQRTLAIRRILAIADEQLKQGAAEGVMESIVAFW